MIPGLEPLGKGETIMSDDIICRNRVYECLGCGFVGREQVAVEHQLKCENPMVQIIK